MLEPVTHCLLYVFFQIASSLGSDNCCDFGTMTSCRIIRRCEPDCDPAFSNISCWSQKLGRYSCSHIPSPPGHRSDVPVIGEDLNLNGVAKSKKGVVYMFYPKIEIKMADQTRKVIINPWISELLRMDFLGSKWMFIRATGSQEHLCNLRLEEPLWLSPDRRMAVRRAAMSKARGERGALLGNPAWKWGNFSGWNAFYQQF